ncbi:MAG TPA: DUF202 domain-containing protein [Rhizomicrobium sp.]|jgi:putative membrane protein
MIPQYSDYAANERTFLAWVRTGIAVIALGFVVEKFYLVLIQLARADALPTGEHTRAPVATWESGRFDGATLIIVGLAIIVVASIRFVRTSHMLHDQRLFTEGTTRPEVILSVILVVIVAAISAHLALG